METSSVNADHAPFHLGDDIDNETVVESLLFEQTGILTDRELRWSIEDIRSDAERLLDEIARNEYTPVLCRDLVGGCRNLAHLLAAWQRQMSASAGSGVPAPGG